MQKLIIISVVLPLFFSCQLDEPVEISTDQQVDQAVSDAGFRKAATFPGQIFIPTGFSPEGIESGKGSEFFVGSLYDGAIYNGDFRNGEGFILVPGQTGRAAVGLFYDDRTDFLYVAGTFGVAFVYNGTTGEELEEIILTTATFPSALVNDCYIAKDVLYFTDSFQPVLYAVELDRNDRLPETINVQIIPLSGDFTPIPGGINGNGIVAPPPIVVFPPLEEPYDIEFDIIGINKN